MACAILRVHARAARPWGPARPVRSCGPARIAVPLALLTTLALQLVAAPALARGGAGPGHRPPLVATRGVTVAVLPLEDFSGTAGAGDKLTAIVFSALAAEGVDVVEPGEVDAAFAALRVRSSGALTREQVRTLAVRLGVRWFVAGSVLEYDMVHTPDGDVPALGLALRLIDGATARVAWAGMSARSGEDRETVFGWGRIRDPQRLALATVRTMIRDIPLPAPSDTVATRRPIAVRDTTAVADTAGSRGGK